MEAIRSTLFLYIITYTGYDEILCMSKMPYSGLNEILYWWQPVEYRSNKHEIITGRTYENMQDPRLIIYDFVYTFIKLPMHDLNDNLLLKFTNNAITLISENVYIEFKVYVYYNANNIILLCTNKAKFNNTIELYTSYSFRFVKHIKALSQKYF